MSYSWFIRKDEQWFYEDDEQWFPRVYNIIVTESILLDKTINENASTIGLLNDNLSTNGDINDIIGTQTTVADYLFLSGNLDISLGISSDIINNFSLYESTNNNIETVNENIIANTTLFNTVSDSTAVTDQTTEVFSINSVAQSLIEAIINIIENTEIGEGVSENSTLSLNVNEEFNLNDTFTTTINIGEASDSSITYTETINNTILIYTLNSDGFSVNAYDINSLTATVAPTEGISLNEITENDININLVINENLNLDEFIEGYISFVTTISESFNVSDNVSELVITRPRPKYVFKAKNITFTFISNNVDFMFGAKIK